MITQRKFRFNSCLLLFVYLQRRGWTSDYFFTIKLSQSFLNRKFQNLILTSFIGIIKYFISFHYFILLHFIFNTCSTLSSLLLLFTLQSIHFLFLFNSSGLLSKHFVHSTSTFYLSSLSISHAHHSFQQFFHHSYSRILNNNYYVSNNF